MVAEVGDVERLEPMRKVEVAVVLAATGMLNGLVGLVATPDGKPATEA
jgi:hypothetical protein